MQDRVPEDIAALVQALDAADTELRDLIAGVDDDLGAWRAAEGSWSIAECIDHLATSNRVYLAAMRPVAERARTRGRKRRGPARPGIIGGWFVRTMEPPVKTRYPTPKKIQPRHAPPLSSAVDAFRRTQDDVRAFLREFADIDLARVYFGNPFIPGVRFSLATGLHVIPAHERRHLWQARRVREAAERASRRS